MLSCLSPAQAVLRPEGRGQPHAAWRRQRIEGVHEVAGHGGRMGQQRDAAAGQRPAQLGLFYQAIDAELHGEISSANAIGMVKIRFARRVALRPVRHSAARCPR